jgi:hypothetical protein
MNENAAKTSYTVLVDDNFHYMDKSERYKCGDFATLEQAVQACEAIVDGFLKAAYKPGMAAEELYKQYVGFGEDPFIQGPGAGFSAWTYAKQRCQALCGGAADGGGA